MERIDDLREPPAVGRIYLVPTVRYRIYEYTADWPVIGPKHTDAEIIGFPHPHYHMDVRFVSKRHAECLVGRSLWTARDIYMIAAAVPLSIRVPGGGIEPHPPIIYRRRKCIRAGRHPERWAPWHVDLTNAYADASIVQTPAGPVCPHKGAPLGSIAPDADGVITCPLHGLRFCAKSGRCLGNETPR